MNGGSAQRLVFADYLEQAKRRGVSHREIGEAAGISIASICAYKKPGANPGIRTVQALARELNKALTPPSPLSSDDLFPPEEVTKGEKP